MNTSQCSRLVLGFLLVALTLAISCRKKHSEPQSQPAGPSATTPETQEDKTALTQKEALEVDKYEEVNPSELSFSIKDFSYEGIVGKGGVVETVGYVGEFLCEGQPLELVSNKIEGGFITTKKFGKIKVSFSPSLTNESVSVSLTAKQKESLIALKKPK